MDPRIADYIRANRRRYTREALTKQLIAAGHDPGEIERVWAALDTRDADDVAGEGFWGRFALILIGINLAVFLGVALLTGMLANLPSSSVILVILAIAMAIGALIAWGIVAATGPTKLSPRTASVIGAAIPALFALLIGGSCYALIGGLGGISGPSGPPPATGTMDVRLEGALDVEGQADAFCHTEGGNGVFLSGEIRLSDRQFGFISINAFADASGAPAPSLLIEAPPADGSEFVSAWGSDMGPAPTEIDWSVEPGAGRVVFRDLPGTHQGPDDRLDGPPAPVPLSGEIGWTCDQEEPR